jgi:hypothetical protein
VLGTAVIAASLNGRATKPEPGAEAARTALVLDELFPDKRVPVTFSAYANAIWQCPSAAEVAVTLNEAAAKAEARG